MFDLAILLIKTSIKTRMTIFISSEVKNMDGPAEKVNYKTEIYCHKNIRMFG